MSQLAFALVATLGYHVGTVAGSVVPAGTDSAGPPTCEAGGGAESSAWSVAAPSRLATLWRPRTELQVSAGDQPLCRIRLVGSTLQSAETNAAIGVGALRLCRVGDSTACRDTLSLKSQETTPVELRLDTEHVPAGAYTGSITLRADGGTGSKSFDLRVEHTSRIRWALGGLALLVGIVLSWLTTTYLRRLSARGMAMAAAAGLAERTQALKADATGAASAANRPLLRIGARLGEIEEALRLDTLVAHDFIPPKLPNPFVVLPDNNAAYAQYLAAQKAKLEPLEIIVEAGLPTAVAASSNLQHRQAALAALEALDEAADKATDVGSAQALVAQILATLRAAITVQRAGAPAPAPAAPIRLPSRREIEIRLQQVSLTAWGIWLLLTLVTGLTVLVLPNYGFGTPLDYCKCLLWGIGLPAAGQQLQQLTANTVATTLNIPVK